MTAGQRPLLRTILDAAIGLTGASDGWLLALDGASLVVAAAAEAPAPGGTRVGARFAATAGSAGFALAAGHPAARRLREGDVGERAAALGAFAPRALSVLAAPCSDDEGVRGVIEVVDKAGGEPFGIDDIELISVLGGIAASALAEAAGPSPAAATPDQLAAGVAWLAARDPQAYQGVAAVVAALLRGRT